MLVQMSIMAGMNRNRQASAIRKCSDSTYSWDETENRVIVSSYTTRLDWGLPPHPIRNHGNIVAVPKASASISLRPLKVLERRSVRRISATLAGLLVCAVAGRALANTTETTAAATSRAAETPPQENAAAESPGWIGEVGSASWYAQSKHSRRTASGGIYNQNAMTAAHPWLPFGAKVRVTRRDTGQSIIVVINDRLPSKKHIIDLSVGAAKELGMIHRGTAPVELEPA